MRSRKLTKCLYATSVAFALSAGSILAQPAGVSLDHVDGVKASDSTQIPAGKPITFYIRLNNQTGADGMCPNNGFKLYSPDGATWNPHIYVDTSVDFFGNTTIDSTYYGAWFDSPELTPATAWYGNCPDLVIFDNAFINTFSGTGWGTGADTVGFAAFPQGPCATAIWDGLSAVAWSISIDSFPQSDIGKTFCIDSAFFPPSGKWLWADGIVVEPPWDGPHCFDIVDCCTGIRGNVDGDPNEQINLPDLTGYVSWAYKGGPAPPCRSEVDVNGDGSVDTADLSYLVKYMFKGGAAPVACP